MNTFVYRNTGAECEDQDGDDKTPEIDFFAVTKREGCACGFFGCF